MLLTMLENVITLPAHHTDQTTSSWINDDIRPLAPSRRRWTTSSYLSFWAINQICLSNWQIGSSLVALGLSIWQAMIAVIIGKIFIATVAVLNGHAGATWHIGYPVLSRMIWGIKGSYLAIVQRIVLGLTWFAVQSWTGGLCVTAVLQAIFPSFRNSRNTLPASANTTTQELAGWIIYNCATVPLLYVAPEKTRRILLLMNGISIATLLSMMIYLLAAAKGIGPLLSEPATAQTSSELGWGIVGSVTTVIGGIAVGLTNQSDYSRFARSPGDQVFGQWSSILGLGTIMPLFGCLATSATVKVYGTAIWNPPDILSKILQDNYNPRSRTGVAFAGLGLTICQLAINTIDNSFSAGMDLAGLFPRVLNIRRGAYFALIISIAMCPWQLLASATTFISVMSAYSVFLGPMVGIQLCDYWLIRGACIKLSDLYVSDLAAIYYYHKGVNWRAFAAWIMGFATQLPGMVANVNPNVSVPQACSDMYSLAFPLGFAISFGVYWVFDRMWPIEGAGLVDEFDYFGTFTAEEARKLGILKIENSIIGQQLEVSGGDSDEGKKSLPVVCERVLDANV